MEVNFIVTTCDYAGIAKYYNLWASGDDSYVPVANFYLSYFKGMQGVFAELGVGTGRIAIPLSKRLNTTVFGIDMSQEMLKQCEKHLGINSNLKLLCSDFLDTTLPQIADVIYMPFRTIGHVLSEEKLHLLFENIKENLKVGGLFVFDHYIFSKKWALEHDNVDIDMYEDSEMKIVDHYHYDFSNSIMHCVVKCNEVEVAQFDFRWIEKAEIENVYPQHGFILEALYGDFDKSNWTPQSPNQIWVLRRYE
jgi:SAM-dependent methyltransferase